MAYQRTDFVNNRVYDEKGHKTALSNGIPDFVISGLEYTGSGTLSYGKGINNGVPFELGNSSDPNVPISGYTSGSGIRSIYVKSKLNGVNSLTELTTSAPVLDGVYYFKIYDVNTTTHEVIQDYRHISYIKSLEFGQPDDSHFTIIINGYESDPFSTSVVSEAYTKSESDLRFQTPQLTMTNGNALGISTNNLNNCTIGGFYRYSSTNPNAPEPVAGVCIVTLNNSSIYQFVQDANNKSFTRLYNSTTSLWTEWKQLLIKEDPTTLMVSPTGTKLGGNVTLSELPMKFEKLAFTLGTDTAPIRRTVVYMDTITLTTNVFTSINYADSTRIDGTGSLYKIFKLNTSGTLVGDSINSTPGQHSCFKIEGITRK